MMDQRTRPDAKRIIADRVALVTGGSRGIGAAVALALVRDGMIQVVQGGTAFSVIVGVPAQAFELSGEVATHVTIGEDHGRETKRRFCPECGSPVMSESDGIPDVVIVKAGTLNDPSWLAPQIEGAYFADL